MPFTGDFSKMGLLVRALAELAKVPSRVARPASLRITDRLRAQFANSTDAYGNPFPRNAPRTIQKKGFDHPMTETGNSAAETRARPASGSGIVIETTEEVFWNMEPGPNRPERPILPKRGLPKTWRADIKAETDKLANEALGKVK